MITSVPKRMLGWIPPHERTDDQHEAHYDFLASLPKYALPQANADLPVGGKLMLTDLWKHPGVISQLGLRLDGPHAAWWPTDAFSGIHQLTGSCVGCGGGNALFSLIAGDALLRGDAEGIVVPFWPLPYGRSRYYCGDRGQGEGSLGSTFAKAVLQDGVLDANDTSLPQFQVKDGLVWGEKVEYAWSDGAAISADFLTNSRKHLVKSAVPLKTTQDVWNQIANGYPVTRAATCFCDVQQAKVQGTGNDAVLVGNYGGYGGHQMSYQGIYNHATLGRLFLEVNQWGDVYGQDPAGGPPSSCWQTEANVKKMIDSDGSEVYAFSGFDGFPPRNIMAFMEQMKGGK